MRVAETTTRVTADELLAMPDGGWRYELVRGELIRMSPASGGHGDVESELLYLVKHHVRTRRLGRVYPGDTGFQLATDPDIVRAPDVAFVQRARAPSGAARRTYFQGPPDLAVEIVSDSESATDIRETIEDYLRAGARLIWIVYPRTRSVTVYRADGTVSERRENDALNGEDVVAGFSCRVGDLVLGL